MSSPIISIIVPVYNSEKYLSECIISILHQSFEDFELIMINDGSTDNSLQICERYSKFDKRIKIASQTNQGVTIARKQGVEMAIGDYILFVDSDDTLPPDSISTLVSATKADIDIIIGALKKEDTIEKILDVNTYRKKCIEGNIFPGPVAKLFKRELFSKSVFDIPKEIIKGEDMIMNVRIAFNCKANILLLPNIVYEYRRHTESCVAKFRTNWSYEGLFYTQLFASVPSIEYSKYMPSLIKTAMNVWNDFYGYKYCLPSEYKSSKLYLLLSENIRMYKTAINVLDKQLLHNTNLFYRFTLINLKRIIRIIKHIPCHS